MSVVIALEHIDPSATQINIYRSTGLGTAIDPNNPGTPFATISSLPATSWTDTGCVNWTIYNYRIGVQNAGGLSVGDLITIGYYPDTGPGNQTIRRGTWMSGFFDEVLSANFTTAANLLSLLQDVSPMLGVSIANPNSLWYKMAVNGKILFIPNYPIFSSTWVAAYQAGIVYGTNDNGAVPAAQTGLVATNQYTCVQINGYNFAVRMLRASLANPAAYQPTGSMTVSQLEPAYALDCLQQAATYALNDVVTNIGWLAGTSWIAALGQTGFGDYYDGFQGYNIATMVNSYPWIPVLEYQPAP